MRVLMVSQYYPPETGAAPARALHFARHLARAGHQVTVITGLPNHPSGALHPEWRGVRRRTEHRDGVAIERVWLHTTPTKTAWTRLWNHVTFAMSALPVAWRAERPDVLFATTPPLFLGLTAWIASRKHRVPLVLDCRDDWPHAAIALGEMKPGFAANVLGALARFVQIRAARVLAVTPGMQRQLAGRGIDSGRIELVTNGADTDLFTPANREQANGAHGHGNGNGNGAGNGSGAAPVTVLYAGTHGLVHGMESILEAAHRLRHRQDIRFLFVGDGVAKEGLRQRAAELALSAVEFLPSQTPERLVDTIRAADVCLATTRAGSFGGETIPVKLFDYMACGRPVVAAVSGDAAAVVDRSHAGIVVPPEQGAALAEALAGLADDPGRRTALGGAGPRFVEANFSRRAIGEQLERILAQVIRASSGRDVAERPTGPYRFIRRVVDVAAAACLLVALSPLLLVLAALIRVDSPGPVLFRQRRIGVRSREFTIFKFRSMAVGTPDRASHLLGPGSPHVTRIGALLRRTSLDELPQLWNVLVGDMTLIGPRPALYNQDDLIGMRQRAGVDALTPGITGLAQIHGRDDMPIERKVEYDRYYLEHHSWHFDVVIAVRTVVVLFSDRGVY